MNPVTSRIQQCCQDRKYQGVIQVIFQIGYHFWADENWHPNFHKLTKDKVFTNPLISKHGTNDKLPPMYIKQCRAFVFVVIIDDFLHFNFVLTLKMADV